METYFKINDIVCKFITKRFIQNSIISLFCERLKIGFLFVSKQLVILSVRLRILSDVCRDCKKTKKQKQMRNAIGPTSLHSL